MNAKPYLALALVAGLGLALGACSSSSDDPPEMMTMEPTETPYETAKAAIAVAATAEAAQAAYNAVKDDVTAAEGEKLQAAVDARIMAINMAARADEQKMALADAAGMIDTSDLSTQELVDAARMAIAGLRQAITDADAVSDADKMMYMSQLDDAVDAVDEAQGGINTATRRTNQMTALMGASTTLQSALAALSGSTPTQAQLDAANNAVTALNAAITAGADLTDDEKAPYQREANNAAAPIRTAQMAFDDAEDEDEKTANAAMAVTASKLFVGIGAAPLVDTGDGVRTAAYSGTNDADITVTFDPDLTETGSTDDTQILKADDTTVADLHGWKGKRYTAAPTGGDMYEAVVYSNVEPPKQSKKFGGAAANDEFEYGLTDGALAIDTSTAGVSARIALTGVTRTAGTETFKLPDPNPNDATAITVPGSYHGVSGTYKCTPATLIGELVFWRRDFGHRQGRPVMPGRRFGLPARA